LHIAMGYIFWYVPACKHTH